MKLALTAFCLLLPAALAQQSTPAPVPAHPVRNFHLRYAGTQAEQNEILTAIRNIVTPQFRVFLVPSRSEIVATGTAEDMKTVETVLAALDRPVKLYRLTYTFTESDGGKRVGLERYSMVLTPGQRMQMKQGSRVPLLTTATSPEAKQTSQLTYLDVGLNFDSEVDEYGPGVRLRSKVEQSSAVEEKSGTGADAPVIRQTVVEGVSALTLGKAVMLGSLDVVGSTRRIEVSAIVEQEPGW